MDRRFPRPALDTPSLQRLVVRLGHQWFLLGLGGVAALTLVDPGGAVTGVGGWLRHHRGPDAIVWVVFFLSGLSLGLERLRAGISDLPVLFLALLLIFGGAPAVALGLSRLPVAEGLRIGLLLVSVMPTTLSTGIVMSTAAGGDAGTALGITVSANALAVATVPLSLEFLLGTQVDLAAAGFRREMLIARIAILVILPLALGILVRPRVVLALARSGRRVPILNQLLVLAMVSIGLSASRATLLDRPSLLGEAVLLSFVFHGILLAVAATTAHLAGFGFGRREPFLFLGVQKTLPLAVLLQTTLFPRLGGVLVMCVVHHLMHLLMDAYVVGWLARRKADHDWR